MLRINNFEMHARRPSSDDFAKPFSLFSSLPSWVVKADRKTSFAITAAYLRVNSKENNLRL